MPRLDRIGIPSTIQSQPRPPRAAPSVKCLPHQIYNGLVDELLRVAMRDLVVGGGGTPKDVRACRRFVGPSWSVRRKPQQMTGHLLARVAGT